MGVNKTFHLLFIVYLPFFFFFFLSRITTGLKDVGGQFSKGSPSSWASFWQHCLTQCLPPVFKKLNHKLNNSRGRGNTRKQSQGRKNMFFACEIPSRDPCSGCSQVTWTLAQCSSRPWAPGRESHFPMHVQLSPETELIKMCVAPSSLHPVLCLFEDHEGPYADTWVLFSVRLVLFCFVLFFK